MRKVVIALVVLVVLLLVADRAGAAYAARSLAEEVQGAAELDEQPDVDITGFPFLTQALAGRYERIEVRATQVPAGDFVLSTLDATLLGVRAPLSDVLSQDVDTVPVDRVTARAVVPYDELSQSYEDRELVVEPEGDRLLLTGALEVSDGTVQAEALASLEVVDGELRVTAEEVAFGEDGERREFTESVRDQLDLQVPVPDLPYDLTLTGAEVGPDGMALDAEATDVVLTAGG